MYTHWPLFPIITVITTEQRKIISDPLTQLTPFSTDSPLEHATDHCPLIQLLSMCVYGMYTYAIPYVYIFPMPSTVSVRTQAP